MRRIVVLCAAAAMLAACQTPAPPQDRAQHTPTSSVHVRPSAPTPPGLVAFPDFNDFQQADVDTYSGKNSHDDTFVTFRTASGMSCFAYVYKTPALGDIACDSKSMPGFPADAKGQELRESARPGSTFTNSVLRMDSASPFEFRITRDRVDNSAKELSAGQRLVINDTGCAVDDDLLACIDGQKHGFVVSPTGSWAF
jgi:hypothetical protein